MNTKIISGAKVVQVKRGQWNVVLDGKIRYTGTLAEIRKALKKH